MDNSWIKLYRKINTHEIMCDPIAYTLFSFILTSVDRHTGKLKIGRIILGQRLRLNDNTIYKSLKRLQQKYQLIDITSNNRFSEISVLNWAKYQGDNDLVTQAVTQAVTTQQQQSNNKVTLIQEYRIREDNNKEKKVLNPIVINTSEVSHKKPPTSYSKKESHSKLDRLSFERLWEIAYKKQIALRDVEQTHERVLESIEEGNKYKLKDVSRALQRWLDRGIAKKDIQMLDTDGMLALQLSSPKNKKIFEEMRQMKIEKGLI